LERLAIFLNVIGSLVVDIASNLLTIRLRVEWDMAAFANKLLALWIFSPSLRLLNELPEKELMS